MKVSHSKFFKRLPLVLLSSSVYSPWSENTKGGQRASRVGPSHWHLLPHQNWRERNKAHWRTKGHPEDCTLYPEEVLTQSKLGLWHIWDLEDTTPRLVQRCSRFHSVSHQLWSWQEPTEQSQLNRWLSLQCFQPCLSSILNLPAWLLCNPEVKQRCGIRVDIKNKQTTNC